MSLTNNFKVIVVGGGPVGMVAAHALTRANIDFVLLERRPGIIIDAGANLVLLPTGLRVLGQLHLLSALDKVTSPLGQTNWFDHSGRSIGDHRFFLHLNEIHGRHPRVVSRHDLTEVLYNSLPAESHAKMHANKKVTNIITTENSSSGDAVTVSCADGTSYQGSLVIGADGAHSLVRGLMRTLALSANDTDHANEEQPFLTTYRAMWVRFPTQRGLKPGDSNETHHKDCTVQLFAGEETSVIGIYERLPEGPTRERVRYGPKDEEALVERWGYMHITGEGLTIRDVYETRVSAGAVSLEEGVVDHWSWGGRIVLAGDAAHKFTPSTGAGCNNGIVDIVVLINELHKLVCAAPNRSPSKENVASALKAYQEKRHDDVVRGCKSARQATDTSAWQSTVLKYVDRFLIGNHWAQQYFINASAPRTAKTPVFDFVEGGEDLRGIFPWEQPLKPVSTQVQVN